MYELQISYTGALGEENKDACIELSIESIEKNIYTVHELYENVLKKVFIL